VNAAADYLLRGWSTLQSMTCHLLSYLSPFCFKNNPVQPFKKIKYSNGAYITSWLQFALLSISLSLTPIRDSLKYYRWYWGYLSLIEVENKGVVAAVKDSKPNSLKIKYTQFVMFILRFVPFQNNGDKMCVFHKKPLFHVSNCPPSTPLEAWLGYITPDY
jgi:hypothetical protein